MGRSERWHRGQHRQPFDFFSTALETQLGNEGQTHEMTVGPTVFADANMKTSHNPPIIGRSIGLQARCGRLPRNADGQPFGYACAPVPRSAHDHRKRPSRHR